MRSGESPRGRESGRRAEEPSATEAPAGEGPIPGDVLTVMTLVSRTGAAFSAVSIGAAGAIREQEASARARSADFLAGGETLTVHDEPPPASPPAEPGAARSKVSPRGRLLGASLAIGLVVAAIVFGALRSEPDKTSPATIHVVIRSPAPGAQARALGVDRAVPATFEALPGDSLEVVVHAPGHRDESVRVAVPKQGARDQMMDVALVPLPVPLVLELVPPGATALVDEVPYQRGMLVAPGKPAMLHVSAPGFLPFKREIEVRPGREHVERVELKAGENPGPPPALQPRPEGRLDGKPRPVAPAKPGILVLRTRDVWGQVTIDGKVLDEVTPLTIELKAGRHTVVVAHPPKGSSKTFVVTLKPGETLTRVIELD